MHFLLFSHLLIYVHWSECSLALAVVPTRNSCSQTAASQRRGVWHRCSSSEGRIGGLVFMTDYFSVKSHMRYKVDKRHEYHSVVYNISHRGCWHDFTELLPLLVLCVCQLLQLCFSCSLRQMLQSCVSVLARCCVSCCAATLAAKDTCLFMMPDEIPGRSNLSSIFNKAVLYRTTNIRLCIWLRLSFWSFGRSGKSMFVRASAQLIDWKHSWNRPPRRNIDLQTVLCKSLGPVLIFC